MLFSPVTERNGFPGRSREGEFDPSTRDGGEGQETGPEFRPRSRSRYPPNWVAGGGPAGGALRIAFPKCLE